MTNSKPIIVIATVSLDSVGGIEAYVINIAQGLFANGWQVHCIATNSRGEAFDNLDKGIVCHDLSALPLTPSKAFTAAKLVNSINPDILLLNNCSLMHYALPLLNHSIKPLAVLHSDDSRFYSIAALFAHRIYRWIAPTSGLAMTFRQYLPPRRSDAVRVIPHGVSAQRFQPAQSKRQDAPMITFVGYVAKNKGADLLPEIMRCIVYHHPNVRLNLVGYGPLRKQLAQQFSSSGIGRNCTFTGPLSSEGVAEVLGVSDIFLLPTRIEGFGLAIAEAMMCGSVPVVSRLAGITDTIVSHNETGMLVEVDDVEGFSSAIIDLLSNPERLASMKQAARKTAQEKFSLQRMIEDYERLFAGEDKRPALPKRGIAGWSLEVSREMTHKNPDGTFRFQHKFGTVKRLVKQLWERRT